MKRGIKVFLASLLVALTAGILPLAGLTQTAEAATFSRASVLSSQGFFLRNSNNFSSSNRISVMNRFNGNNNFTHRRAFIRNSFNPVRFNVDRTFFIRNNVYTRYPIFQNIYSSTITPREIVLIDRDNVSNVVVVQNSVTGPFSVNRVVLQVSDSFFNTIMNDINVNLDQNVSVSVDTGNNIVRFNTVTGAITTGDVTIMVQ